MKEIFKKLEINVIIYFMNNFFLMKLPFVTKLTKNRLNKLNGKEYTSASEKEIKKKNENLMNGDNVNF